PETPPSFDPKTDNERQAPNVWPARRLDGHTNEVTRLLATPDGKHLVSASLDHTIRVWPVDGQTARKTEVVLDAASRLRAARRSGKKEATPVPGVPVETQAACTVLDGHKDWVYALGMSADGKRAISGDAASQVIVWDLVTCKPVTKWSGHLWNWIVAA